MRKVCDRQPTEGGIPQGPGIWCYGSRTRGTKPKEVGAGSINQAPEGVPKPWARVTEVREPQK